MRIWIDMKTYNDKIKKLNKNYDKARTLHDQIFISGQIEQLNSDRNEAIKEVRKLQNLNLSLIESDDIEVEGQNDIEINENQAVIDYLIAKFNIKESEINES